jgi:uncharacterized damage-inducible protein DinB
MDADRLRQNLVSLLNEGEAHLNLTDSLRGLNPELRNVRPTNDAHSVWELLEHIRIAQNDIVEYIFNPEWVSPKWPEGYWTNTKGIIRDADWNACIKQIEKDRKALTSLIEDENIDLTEVIPHSKNHTYLREIFLTADHNAYHTAQIVLIRKMLKNWDA